ncbi:2-dehydro-3-deoxygalactonokinase [Escherichia coli]
MRSRRHAPNGKSPAAVLAEVTTDWREENTPVVMAGMVGSNVGWKILVLICSCPFFVYWRTINVCWATISGLFPDYASLGDDNHNVMRGEETQSIGARALVLPPLCYARYALQMGAGR